MSFSFSFKNINLQFYLKKQKIDIRYSFIGSYQKFEKSDLNKLIVFNLCLILNSEIKE